MTYLFSDEDADLRMIDWLIHPSGYAYRKKKMAHRIVLERILDRPLVKGELTDHKNRNKKDNRRNNIRLANKSLNTINRNIRPDNTTGYVGVYKHHPKSWRDKGWAASWSVRIQRNGKIMYLGYYKSAELAHKERLNFLNKNQ